MLILFLVDLLIKFNIDCKTVQFYGNENLFFVFVYNLGCYLSTKTEKKTLITFSKVLKNFQRFGYFIFGKFANRS